MSDGDVTRVRVMPIEMVKAAGRLILASAQRSLLSSGIQRQRGACRFRWESRPNTRWHGQRRSDIRVPSVAGAWIHSRLRRTSRVDDESRSPQRRRHRGARYRLSGRSERSRGSKSSWGSRSPAERGAFSVVRLSPCAPGLRRGRRTRDKITTETRSTEINAVCSVPSVVRPSEPAR